MPIDNFSHAHLDQMAGVRQRLTTGPSVGYLGNTFWCRRIQLFNLSNDSRHIGLQRFFEQAWQRRESIDQAGRVTSWSSLYHETTSIYC
ncbi:hypothetical protein [Nitrosomonas sp.]|uniref:hypothetical protein n=1 Tax=Nitrosomonas sp. TaxID=42353 RepID=UPI0026269138|nr:hypothetical protein [Nitrosomonas sp.]